MNPVIPGTSFVRVDPTIGEWFRIVDWGKSNYNALYLALNKRYSHGWALSVAYTLSESKSDTEHEFSRQDSYDDLEKKFMYGPTDLDARHTISIFGIVDLPLGFQIGGTFYYRSALPWNAAYAYDKNMDGIPPGTDYIDEYRNSRRGFDLWSLNARLSKYFLISRFRIQLFVEGYNLTNRTNFMQVFNLYHDVFPEATPLFGKPLQAGDPRLLQFGVRLDF